MLLALLFLSSATQVTAQAIVWSESGTHLEAERSKAAFEAKRWHLEEYLDGYDGPFIEERHGVFSVVLAVCTPTDADAVLAVMRRASSNVSVRTVHVPPDDLSCPQTVPPPQKTETITLRSRGYVLRMHRYERMPTRVDGETIGSHFFAGLVTNPSGRVVDDFQTTRMLNEPVESRRGCTSTLERTRGAVVVTRECSGGVVDGDELPAYTDIFTLRIDRNGWLDVDERRVWAREQPTTEFSWPGSEPQ